MIRHLVTSVILGAALLAAPSPASAEIFATVPAVYDTVDAIEVIGNRLTVTGIIAGQGTTSELVYSMSSAEGTGARCDRLALLAMSKPGKYQFATVRISGLAGFGCKLVLRAP